MRILVLCFLLVVSGCLQDSGGDSIGSPLFVGSSYNGVVTLEFNREGWLTMPDLEVVYLELHQSPLSLAMSPGFYVFTLETLNHDLLSCAMGVE